LAEAKSLLNSAPTSTPPSNPPPAS
jgi:hypothetical protein